MLKKINLENILFLDIETVPQEKNFNSLSPEAQQLWEEKTTYLRKEEFTAEDYYHRAGIWAEFGKIICISAGFFNFKENIRKFRLTSFKGEEEQLLSNFGILLEKHFSKPQHLLCAHNGKEFDFPFIARRMLIHGLPLPEKLNLFGKKPWEVGHLDTLELWKFGDYKHYTSLKLLTHILGIPSPKTDIDGSQVHQVYYEENGITRILDYCERDVVAIAQVFLKFRREKLLEEADIQKLENFKPL